MTEREGFIIEAALAAGAEIMDIDAELFQMTEEQILKFSQILMTRTETLEREVTWYKNALSQYQNKYGCIL